MGMGEKLCAYRSNPFERTFIMRRRVYSTAFTVFSGGTKQTIYGFDDDFLLSSEGHPLGKDGKYHTGGPFYVRKRHFRPIVGPTLDWTLFGVRNVTTPYVGTFSTTIPVQTSVATATQRRLVFSSDAGAFGATGWKRARPGNPTAGVAAFIGELREGLPRIPFEIHRRLSALLQNKTFARRTRGNLGDEYLNGVFGWLPLLSDIRKMHKTYQNMDKQLARIVRENGQGVHKRREIRDTNVITSSTTRYGFPFGGFQNPPLNWAGGVSQITTENINVDKIWFVGKFRYYIPDIGSSQWSRRAQALLYGANITPEVVWQLTPWSWLFDWFGNVGDVMSNMSTNAVDNLSADYAYIMRTVETTTRTTASTQWVGRTGDGTSISSGSLTLSAVDSTVEKVRVGASPFGFGITFDGLSAYQLGVAAALGISRASF